MELALPKNEKKLYYIGNAARPLCKNENFHFFSELSQKEVQKKIKEKFPNATGKLSLGEGKHKISENNVVSLPSLMRMYSYQEDIIFLIQGCDRILVEENSFVVQNLNKERLSDLKPCYFVRMTKENVPSEYVVSKLKNSSVLGDNFIIFKDYIRASLFVRTYAKKPLFILIKKCENKEWEKCSKEEFRSRILNNPTFFEDYEYQTFSTQNKVEMFISEYKEKVGIHQNTYEVFVDGSCVPSKKKYSWAFVVYHQGREIYFDKGHEEREQHIKYGSQVGEFLAMIHAINYIMNNNIKDVIVHYDNTNNFNCMNFLVKNKETEIFAKYYSFMKEKNRILQKRGVNVLYKHVKAHSGNKGNERADLLAKRAIKEADYFF